MILILSQDMDTTTANVIDWLHTLGGNYIRINGIDIKDSLLFYSIDSEKKKFEIKIENRIYRKEDINVVWFRRFQSDPFIKFQENIDNTYNIKESIVNHIKQENLYLLSLLSSELSNKYWLNHPSQGRLNKMQQLQVAKACDIDFPKTIITSKKTELVKFKSDCKKIITKPIQEVSSLIKDDKSFVMYTKLVSDSFIENLDSCFFPSLFQEYIEKDYEIRSFYLEGKFYSMAMFTQSDPNTQIDFRNYNHQNPSRRVPYKLPKELENKLDQFMRIFKINCGSFDLIKSKNGRYVFLELNPVGQFGMTSIPCNYNLEKEVALHLITKDNEYGK